MMVVGGRCCRQMIGQRLGIWLKWKNQHTRCSCSSRCASAFIFLTRPLLWFIHGTGTGRGAGSGWWLWVVAQSGNNGLVGVFLPSDTRISRTHTLYEPSFCGNDHLLTHYSSSSGQPATERPPQPDEYANGIPFKRGGY